MKIKQLRKMIYRNYFLTDGYKKELIEILKKKQNDKVFPQIRR